MTPEGMFKFYASIPFLILGVLIIIAIIKIVIEKITGKYHKSNKIRKIDITNCAIETLEMTLNSISNKHKLIRIRKDTIFYVDEYNIYVIMFKNWLGNVIGNKSDEIWNVKSTKDYKVNNAYIELNNILINVKKQITNDNVKGILVLNGLLNFNMYDKEIETIRIDNIRNRLSKKIHKKQYSESQIDVMCKQMSKDLH